MRRSKPGYSGATINLPCPPATGKKSHSVATNSARSVPSAGEIEEHPEKTALQSEADAELQCAIRTLDDKHRIPLVLRYYHDMSIADIASMLEVPIGTIHSRLTIARAKLCSVLKKKESLNDRYFA